MFILAKQQKTLYMIAVNSPILDKDSDAEVGVLVSANDIIAANAGLTFACSTELVPSRITVTTAEISGNRLVERINVSHAVAGRCQREFLNPHLLVNSLLVKAKLFLLLF